MQNRRWLIFKGQIKRSILQKSSLDWSVVLICLVLASSVWLITALSKTYSDIINIPATFVFDDTVYNATVPLPKKVKLKVTGTGWSLIKHQLGLSKSKLTLLPEKDNNTGSAYFSTKKIYQNVMVQMPDLKVSFMYSDSLNFVLDPVVEQYVSLELDTSSVKITDGLCRTSSIQIHPSVIKLKGTRKELSQLGNRLSLKLAGKSYNSDVEEVVFLGHQAYPKLIFPQQEALVSFSVGRLAKHIVKVPIVNYCPYPLSQDSISLLCQVDTRKVNALVLDSFKVSAKEVSRQSKIALSIDKAPRFALNTSVSDLSALLRRTKKAKL